MVIVTIPVTNILLLHTMHASGACFVPFPWHPGYMQDNRGTVTLQWQPWTAGGFPTASELLREPQTLRQTSYAAAEMPGTSQSWDKRGGVCENVTFGGFGCTAEANKESCRYLESLKCKLHVIGLLQIHIVHEQLTGSHLHEHCQQLQAESGGMGIESTSFYVNSLCHGNQERELVQRINVCACPPRKTIL